MHNGAANDDMMMSTNANGGINPDALTKERMREVVADYMTKTDVRKKIK